MPPVHAGAAEIHGEVVRIGGRSRQILGVVEGVIPEQRYARTEPRIEVEHQDVLPHVPAALEFNNAAGAIAVRENAVGGAQRKQGVERSRKRRVDVHALREVHGAVIGVRHRHGRRVRQLPLDADGALHAQARLQIRIHHVDLVRPRAKRGQRRDIRVKRGVVHRVGELVHAVVQNGVLIRPGADAIVKEADAAADDGLLPPALGLAGRPREADARSDIAVIGDKVLHFIAQTQAQREVRAQAPVVLYERTGVPADAADVGHPALYVEARRSAAQLLDLRAGEARLLQLQEKLVLRQRSEGPGERGAARIRHDVVARIQHRDQTADETEPAAETRLALTRVALTADPHAEAYGVYSAQHRGVVLQFVMMVQGMIVPPVVTAGRESAGDAERGNQVALRVGEIPGSLETRFVHHLRAENGRLGEHQFLAVAHGAVGNLRQRRRQSGAAESGVVAMVEMLFKARDQGVVGAQLVIHPRLDGRVGAGRHQRVVVVQNVQRVLGIHVGGVGDGVVRDIPAIEFEHEGRPVVDGAAEVPAEHAVGIVRLVGGQGVARVEDAVAVVQTQSAAVFVGTRLGQDFDAPETQPVEFRGKRIGVDADFANRFLGGQLAAAEAVDVDLSAVRPGARPCQGLQRVRQVVGIVRQRLQVFAPDHQLGGVIVRLHAERWAGFAFHHDFLLLGGLHRQLDGNLQRAACRHCHLLHDRLETRKRQAHGVVARFQTGERVGAVRLRLRRLGGSVPGQGNGRSRNHAAGIVGQRAFDRTGLLLGQRGSRKQRDG